MDQASRVRVVRVSQADPHGAHLFHTACAIGAEQPVPDAEHVPEIAVGLALHRRVMNVVHLRRDHQPSQERLGAAEMQIGMRQQHQS
jgi:hypothetical protein